MILRKSIFGLAFNTCFFLFLIIGIQNSATKNKVNLLIDKTIDFNVLTPKEKKDIKSKQ